LASSCVVPTVRHRLQRRNQTIATAYCRVLETATLQAMVVGSGLMAEHLAGGNFAVALLADTIATGAPLVALILTFGNMAGAHFNPAVKITDVLLKGISWVMQLEMFWRRLSAQLPARARRT
jgi:glycerol uptake facilitator-like aquaporin